MGREGVPPEQGPRKVARYIRVSKSVQRPELQADETAEFLARRGWSLVDTYLDRGETGSNDRRPELDRLLADARRGKFDTILVWKSDRVFRSLRHMLNTLAELAAVNINFVSVTEAAMDTTTPQGRLLLHLVAAFAEFERSLLIERTIAGQAAARRRGVRIGRPPADIDVPRAAKMRAGGMSLREIARDLGVGVSTLHRALKDHDGDDAEEPDERVPEPRDRRFRKEGAAERPSTTTEPLVIAGGS